MTQEDQEEQVTPSTKISHAQNGEDVRAWRALEDVDEPFYVEVGASDPVVDSLTASLSALGWRGVLVEPEPSIAQRLREARPRDVVVAAAAHSSSGVLSFSYADKRGQGQVSAGPVADAREHDQVQISVPAVRLADVLDDVAPSDVHFMSIDVEGHEADALLGLGLDRWRPWVLCIEATRPDSRTPSWEGWHPLLVEADYHFVAFDGLNRWYVSAEHRDLADRVAEPHNVLDEMLDGWRRSDTEGQRDVIAQLNAEIARLQKVLGDQSETVEGQKAELAARQREVRLLRDELDSAQAEVQRLSRDVHQIGAERDAVAARERVMLTSKSWRVTQPLRMARWRAGLTLGGVGGGRLRGPAAAGGAPIPVVEDSPADARRRRAFHAKLAAARLRGGSR